MTLTSGMSDAVHFYLDQKNVFGKAVATIGEEKLAAYGGKFYVVNDGTPVTRKGKLLRYTENSLPKKWKDAMKTDPGKPSEAKKEAPVEPVAQKTPRKRKSAATGPKEASGTSAGAGKAAAVGVDSDAQERVDYSCPYCGFRHQTLVNKGKKTKSFFETCSGCREEFAVRLVPVTIHVAQVAGFRKGR